MKLLNLSQSAEFQLIKCLSSLSKIASIASGAALTHSFMPLTKFPKLTDLKMKFHAIGETLTFSRASTSVRIADSFVVHSSRSFISSSFTDCIFAFRSAIVPACWADAILQRICLKSGGTPLQQLLSLSC